MNESYLHLSALTEGVEIPKDGILSKTLLNDERAKVVLFGFDKGQELSEHTASMPAILQFVSGEADLKLGTDPGKGLPGDFVYMQPNLPHSVFAVTPVVMLLVLIKNAEGSAAAH